MIVIVYWVTQWTSVRIRVNMKEDRIISSKWLRLGTLGLLYFVQGAPYGFQASSLPGLATNSISSLLVIMDLKFRHEVKNHWSWWKILSSTFFRLWVDQDALHFHTSKTRQKKCAKHCSPMLSILLACVSCWQSKMIEQEEVTTVVGKEEKVIY